MVHVRPLDLAQRAKDSQKIKKKTNISRVTDERWNSQKQLSGLVEKKEEKTLISSSKVLTRFSSLQAFSVK